MTKRTQARLNEVQAQMSLIAYQPYAQLPEPERPRARALREGVSACNTAELLQLVIGGPQAEQAARHLLAHCHDLRGIATATVLELAATVHGLGLSKALHLRACLELGRRLSYPPPESRPQLRTPAEVARLLIPEMSLLEQEEVRTVLLDTRNRLIGLPMIYRGSLNAANMRICELFREAIRNNAASLILAHNHPSSDPSPSADDVQVTREVVRAGKLLDIETLDHLIIGGDKFVSLKERGLGFDL